MNDSRKGFLRADPDAPATPSSYEMHRAALRKARESAAQRSAASAYEARHANEHLKRQLQELRKELLQRDAAVAKLERMLAHAEERVRHNYEVAERRGKAAAEMREALEWVHMGSLCCDPATSYRSRADCLICKALARAKEAGL